MWRNREVFSIARSPPIPTCQRAGWIGSDGRCCRRKCLCGYSHGGLRGGRSEVDENLISVPEPCARPYHARTCLHLYPARRGGHRRMWNMRCAGSKSRQRRCPFRTGKIFVGRAEETEAHIAAAARLSPRDTNGHVWKTFAGVARLVLGSYEQAAARIRRAIEEEPKLSRHRISCRPLASRSLVDSRCASAVKARLALNRTFAISRGRATRRR